MPYKDRATYLQFQRKYAYLNNDKKAQYDAEYYKERETVLKKKQRARKRTGRQFLAQYKLDRGCAICGYKGHPDALHFDHLPGSGKKYNLGDCATRKWSEVLAEIKKCQILCANCHAIETASRRRQKSDERKEQCHQLKLRLG